MTRPSVDDVIRRFDLAPLEGEGGLFHQTWIRHGDAGEVIGTAIMYLVTPNDFSALHKLVHDEVFHFYLGDPCEMVVVAAGGSFERVVLGQDVLAGERVQHVVPGGVWQGMRLCPGGSWALLGTTMAPGFLVEEFTLASEDDIAEMPADVAARVRDFLATAA